MEIKSDLVSRVELITPELAKKYLEKNVKNRKVNEYVVNTYANEMKAGRWRLDGQSIKFTKSGLFADGQHRLYAVIKSGCSVPMYVTRGLEDDAFETLDTGNVRKASDIFSIYDIPNGITVSSIVRRYLLYNKRWTSKGNSNAGKITNTNIVQEYISDEDFFKKIYVLASRWGRKSRLLNVVLYGGIAAHLIKELGHKEEDVVSFFEEFSGWEKESRNCITLLRQKLTNDLVAKKKIPFFVKMVYIIKTWNAYISCSEMKQLKYLENTDKNTWFI